MSVASKETTEGEILPRGGAWGVVESVGAGVSGRDEGQGAHGADHEAVGVHASGWVEPGRRWVVIDGPNDDKTAGLTFDGEVAQ